MARPSKIYKITDPIGERVDPELLQTCEAHTDCFAWVEGRCTALNCRADTNNCGFYKPKDEALLSCRKSYERLKDQDRADLIAKYIKPLTALGMLDDEIAAAEQYGEQFGRYEESGYQEMLEKALSSDGADESRVEGADDSGGDDDAADDG